jgi:hypothetical protein
VKKLVKPPSQKVMLRVPVHDLERARAIAERKGIGYQTYIEMLLYQGVERDSRKAGRSYAPNPGNPSRRCLRGPALASVWS